MPNTTSPPQPTDTFDPLSSAPVIFLISSASAVLALGICSLVLFHCCIAIYVFRMTAPRPPDAAVIPTDLLIHQPPPVDAEDADNMCYICVETGADTMLLACGHRGLCSACATRLWRVDRRCPLCRRRLSGLVFLRGYHGEPLERAASERITDE